MNTLTGAGAIIKNQNDHVFLIKVERRGMIRWELPSAVRKEGESIFLSLCRCVEEDSSFKYLVRIGRPVCLVLNSSPRLGYQYYAMFFECNIENNIIKPTHHINDNLPEEIRQKVLDNSFLDWRKLAPTEIHPQHHEILNKWSQMKDESLFAVVSDADSEQAFYYDKEPVVSHTLDASVASAKYIPYKSISNRKEEIESKGRKKTVFISYAQEDYEKAKELYDDLKKMSIKTWIDKEDLLPGQNWKTEIPRIIRQSNYFLFLISSHSITQKGFVQKEQKIALEILKEFPNNEIFIIPAKLDDTEPLDETLQNLHGADLSSYEKGLKQILRTILGDEKNLDCIETP